MEPLPLPGREVTPRVAGERPVAQADINQSAALAGHGAGRPGSVLAASLPQSAFSLLHQPVAMAVNPQERVRSGQRQERGSVLLNQSDSVLVGFRVLE